jgi:hypothetical protein
MIAGLITPSGNLSALTPQQVTVRPIAAVAVAVGNLVRFDASSATLNTTYSSQTNLENYDEPNCPFNVVVLAAAGNEAGPFGVVTEAAAAGSRCTVCVAGVVAVKATAAAISRGDVVIPGAGAVLAAPSTAADGSGAPLGVALEAFAASETKRILLNGFVFAVGGA